MSTILKCPVCGNDGKLRVWVACPATYTNSGKIKDIDTDYAVILEDSNVKCEVCGHFAPLYVYKELEE